MLFHSSVFLHLGRLMDFLQLNRLRELKAKLKEQRKHLDELDKHMYVNLSPLSFALT